MLIAGVDEVGRGCLAGPVVTCAIILKEDFYDERIRDSKKLSKKMREKLYPFILENAITYGIGVVCPIIIDKINIFNAVKHAMHLSLSRLNCSYDKLIVDAVALNNIHKDYIHPFKADDNYIQVSAASIIAKVYRDRLMEELAKKYPYYKWEKNAGYGTKEHIDGILNHGLTEVHRKSFCRKFL